MIRSFRRVGMLVVSPLGLIAAEAPPVADYEWSSEAMSAHANRLIPNSGRRGRDAEPAPQFLAASGVALDEDGTFTHRRVVWDPEVVDPLGNHEATTLEFSDFSQKQSFLVRSDHSDLPNGKWELSVWVKQVGPVRGRYNLGSSSDFLGSRIEFEAPPEWTRVHVELNPSEQGVDLVLRPAAGSPFPSKVAIYAPTIQEAGLEPVDLTRFRVARQAGHAMAPIAKPDALALDSDGALLSGDYPTNVQAELTPEPVSSFAISGWIRVDELPKARAYFAGFSRTEDPSERAADWGSIGIYGAGEAEDFRGRLQYDPGPNLDKQLYSPHVDGSGWLHVHINYGHPGSDAPIADGKVAHELLINGIPFHERATAPIGNVVPRLFSLGGLDGSGKSVQRGEGIWNNSFDWIRYEPNQRISRDEVLARVKQDRETIPKLREPLDAMVLVEGDSTSQQRGSPMFMFSRALRQPGRLFVNHARGGSWFQGGKESNTDYIGTGQRRAMRREALTHALDLGYRKVFTLWTPGENDGNGRGVLGPDGSADLAVRTFTDFVLDDLDAVDPGRERSISILVSMKMSDFRDEVKSQVRAYWQALDAIYSEPVDPVNAPYLYRAPSGHGDRTHDYFIAMHQWAPTNGHFTWPDWDQLARDAKADQNGARDIISGDGQHWTQGWNPHVAEAVHIPSLRKIFELEGVGQPASTPPAIR